MDENKASLSHVFQSKAPKRIAIVGTGVAGLRTAQLVAQKTRSIKNIVLFEAEDRIGGLVHTVCEKGYTIEQGPQGVLLQRESFARSLVDLGLEPLRAAKDSRARFLLTSRSLVRLSPNLFSFVKNNLLSFHDILRLLGEPFVKKNPVENETLYGFFARRFGERVAAAFVVPMARGIWGGGAHSILVSEAFPALVQFEQDAGSVAKGAFLSKKKQKNLPFGTGLANFLNGMSVLPNTLYSRLQDQCTQKNIQLETRLRTYVTSLHIENGLFKIGEEDFDLVVWAAPPWKLQSPFREEKLTKLWNVFFEIPRHSLNVVTLGGKGSTEKARGFGALATDSAVSDLLGILFVHSIFEEHAPRGHFLFRLIYGGERNPEFFKNSPETMIQLAKSHLNHYGLVSENVSYDIEKVARYRDIVPIPNKHHPDVVKAIAHIEDALRGFYFAGNYIRGVGVADALQSAELVAERVLSSTD